MFSVKKIVFSAFLVIAIAMALFTSSIAATSGKTENIESKTTRQPGSKPAEAKNPLKLEMMISMDKPAVTFILRATNTSKKTLTVGRFRHSQNHMVYRYPNGRIIHSHLCNYVKPHQLNPGQTLEWTYVMQSRVYRVPGVYSVYWKVGDQRTPEILLHCKAKEKKVRNVPKKKNKVVSKGIGVRS